MGKNFSRPSFRSTPHHSELYCIKRSNLEPLEGTRIRSSADVSEKDKRQEHLCGSEERSLEANNRRKSQSHSGSPPDSLSANRLKEQGTSSHTTSTSSHRTTEPWYVNSIQNDFEILKILDHKPKKGVVYGVRSRHAKDAPLSVLKVFPSLDNKRLDRRRQEASMHCMASQSRHPHIAAFLNRHDYALSFCIEMEYCQVGDMAHLPKTTPVLQRLDLVRQVATALKYLHYELGMVHTDVKPANVGLASLSNGQLVAKLIDFGSAQTELGWKYQGESFGGTTHYKAPESFYGGPGAKGTFRLCPALDIWGLGMVMIIALTGQLPWLRAELRDARFNRFFAHMKVRLEGSYLEIPLDGVSVPLPVFFYKHLVPGLLHPFPNKRYKAVQVEARIEEYLAKQDGTFHSTDDVKYYVPIRRLDVPKQPRPQRVA